MSTTLIVDGFGSGFAITQGYGDSSNEPPPTPPGQGIESAVLGEEEGGLVEEPHDTILDTE